jgi:hypothetical protein
VYVVGALGSWRRTAGLLDSDIGRQDGLVGVRVRHSRQEECRGASGLTGGALISAGGFGQFGRCVGVVLRECRVVSQTDALGVV